MKVLLVLFYILASPKVYSYVNSKSNAGDNLKWNIRENNIFLQIDTSATGDRFYNLDEESISEIITNSVEQWNDHSSIAITPQYTNSLPPLGESTTLRFTENPAYFGSGVLAVTTIEHDPKNGVIFSADILVNESSLNSTFFSGSPALSSGSEYAYLGDVITHEVGHLLGLAHSEVTGSTMLYSIFKGQHEIAADDIAGLKNIYDESYGRRYKGRVIGGDKVPIFGANVQMILHSTGEVYAAQISNEKGEFYFDDPPADDYFVIYVSPPKSLVNLPSYYATTQTDYCNGSYKPAFFSKCGGREKGRPQLFSTSYAYEDLLDSSVSAESYDLGDVTIRCNDNINPNYIYNKFQTDGTFELFSFDRYQYQWEQAAGDIFVGKFSDYEVEEGLAGKGDVFEVDYRDLDNPNGQYMDLRISTESIGSMLDLTVTVKRTLDGVVKTYTTETESETNKKILNFHIKHMLSSVPEYNHYEITIKPADSSTFTEEDQVAIIAMPSVLKNSENHYLMMLSLGTYEDFNYTVLPPKQYKYPEDNAYCSEGTPSYTAQANISADNGSTAQEQEQTTGISCGTIDIDDDSNSGPMSFMLGISLILFMMNIRQTLLKFLSN